MRTKRIRFAALSLAAVLLLSGLASCGGGTPAETASDTGEPALPVTTEAETEPETSYVETLEKRDLNGLEFHIIGQDYAERQNFYHEENDGILINDSLHDRDVATEERLNASLVFHSERDRTNLTKIVHAAVLANDDTYDLIINSPSASMNTLTTNGDLQDLFPVPHLTLTSLLWNESVTVNMEMYGKLYFTMGTISPLLYQTPIVMMFNKRLIGDYNLEDPYKVVLDGRWTIDKLAEMTAGVTHDLNGDGVIGTEDFWGLVIDSTFGNALYVGAGLEAREFRDGKYRLAVGDEPFVDLVEKCSRLFGDRSVVLNDVNGSKDYGQDIFEPGHALFMDNTVLGVFSRRDMKDDFGIIPCPKATEDQEKYISTCNTWLSTGVAIPVTNGDTETTGLIMETMAAFSYDLVVPAVYETTLRGKVSRDADDWKMLDIIYENLSFDFVAVFDPGTVSSILRLSMIGERDNYVSAYAAVKEKAQSVLDDFALIAQKQS